MRKREFLVLMMLIMVTVGSQAATFAGGLSFDPDDAWYHDKYFDRTRTFTLQGEEILVRYEPQSAAMASDMVAQAHMLTGLHPMEVEYFHAHYRVPPGRDVLAVAADIAADPGVRSAFPVLVDDEGYEKPVVGHELTVRFAAHLDDAACRSIIAGMGSEVARAQRTAGYYTVTVPRKMTLFQAIRAYNAMDDVRFAEFATIGYDMFLMSPDDTHFPDQWYLANTGQVESCWSCSPYENHDINAEAAWDYTTGSRDVIVAVIDTGCDMDHDDIVDNICRAARRTGTSPATRKPTPGTRTVTGRPAAASWPP
jgi:hypothetical protein